MTNGGPERIVFCVSARSNLAAGNADLSHIHSRLMTPELGACSHSSPPPLADCVSKSSFLERLSSLLSKWQTKNQLIFYFSGHGETRHDIYCLKLGATEADWHPFPGILLEFQASNVTRAIIIIDACYSANAIKSDGHPISKDALPKGMVLLASSGEMQASQELAGGSASVFTRLLCDALDSGLGNKPTPDGFIGAEDVVPYMELRLENDPEYSGYSQRPRFSIREADQRIWIAKNRSGRLSESGDGSQFLIGHETVRSDAELRLLYESMAKDRRPIVGATVDLLDQGLLTEFARQSAPIPDGSNVPIEKLAAEAGLISDLPGSYRFLHRAAVICFCRHPERFFPMATSKLLVGAVGGSDFTRPEEFKGPLAAQFLTLYSRTVANLENVSRIGADGLRYSACEIDDALLREIISNAFVHRDYDIPGCVEVRINRDVIEIRNPGAFRSDYSWEVFLSQDTAISVPVDPAVVVYAKDQRVCEQIGRGFELVRKFLADKGGDVIRCTTLPGPITCVRIKRPRSIPAESQSIAASARYVRGESTVETSPVVVQLMDGVLRVTAASSGYACQRVISGDIALLLGWTEEYLRVSAVRNPTVLAAIGRELYSWLNGSDRWLDELRQNIVPPFIIEFQTTLNPDHAGRVFLNTPWELLADEKGFLAGDPVLGFAPFRRLGARRPSPPLDDYRLGIMFMAASPRGAAEFDFEAEEAAIMRAVGSELDVIVEESGNASELARRIASLEPPPSVFHFSGHGHVIVPPASDHPEPVLLLETSVGDALPTTARQLADAFGGYQPKLVVLSSCFTAGSPYDPTSGRLADSMAALLIRSGLPAVVGWEGQVADSAATEFTRSLYDGLARKLSLPQAVATARRSLLGRQLSDSEHSPFAASQQPSSTDWHLARVWVGPEGGGPIVGGRLLSRHLKGDRSSRELSLLKSHGLPEEFGQGYFVGRRREMQQIVRLLRGHRYSGIIIQGMAGSGKSCLAARAADRFPEMTLVPVFGSHDIQSIMASFADALLYNNDAMILVEEWAPRVTSDAEMFGAFIRALVTGPCSGHSRDSRAVLILLDDFEQSLKPAPRGGGHEISAPESKAIEALVQGLDPKITQSRILITTRYAFVLNTRSKSLTRRLTYLHLGALADTDRRKLANQQVQYALTSQGTSPLSGPPFSNDRRNLIYRAQSLAKGIPALQALLIGEFVLNSKASDERVQAVVSQIEVFLNGGPPPTIEPLRSFVERLQLDDLLVQAGASGRELLRALTCFNRSLPETAIAALSIATGGNLVQLRDLSLLIPGLDFSKDGSTTLAANPLAASRLAPLSTEEIENVARTALPTLIEAWGQGRHEEAAASVELARLAILAFDSAVVRQFASAAVSALLAQGKPQAAVEIGRGAISMLDRTEDIIPLDLLSLTAGALQVMGEGQEATVLLEKARLSADRPGADLDQRSTYLWTLGNRQFLAGDLIEAEAAFREKIALDEQRGSAADAAMARAALAQMLVSRGDLDEALRIRADELLPLFSRLGDVRQAAIIKGQIADILEARGEWDEALRLRADTLEVFQKLGYEREATATIAQVADTFEMRGEIEEALRVRIERVIPFFDKTGEVAAAAATRRKIAAALARTGQLREALHLLRDEVLPVFERSGDLRSRAKTLGQIADILQSQGDYDEALRIRHEDELPVYTRLGDVRERALALGKIADLLEARGDFDEALRIRHEDELPVYTRLGDIRERALTLGKIADILQARGDLEEALRIRYEEELPVYNRLGDIRQRAVTFGKVAGILQARGELDEALRLRREEQLPVFDRLGDVWSHAVAMGEIARILQIRGELDEALRIYREEQLPVFDRLGDVRSRAVTLGCIADILHNRGETAEALRIRNEEQLPVFDRLGDIQGRALTLAKIAAARLELGELTSGDNNEILNMLREAFGIVKSLNLVEGIAFVGVRLAEILSHLGLKEEGIAVSADVNGSIEKLRSSDVLRVQGNVAQSIMSDRTQHSKATRLSRISESMRVSGTNAAVRLRCDAQYQVFSS